MNSSQVVGAPVTVSTRIQTCQIHRSGASTPTEVFMNTEALPENTEAVKKPFLYRFIIILTSLPTLSPIQLKQCYEISKNQ
jgi:hypothetical protein